MNQKTQIIVAVVLGVALVGVLVFQLTRGSSESSGPAPAAAKTAGPPAAKAGAPAAKTAAGPKPAAAGKAATDGHTQIKKADVNIDELLAGIKEVDFDYDKDRLPRDPMTPLVGTLAKTREKQEDQQEAEKTPMTATAMKVMNKVVSGVLWDVRRPLAVVDNEVVYPGFEYPDGTVVESIERDRVVFKVGDSLIQVQLKEL